MIEALNKEYSEEMQELVAELDEREEYACTVDGCVGKVCGVE